MKAKHCEWCDNQFTTKISYQIYCSVECREAATKEKIMNRYAITRRNRLAKKSRKCKACDNNLSAYNDEQLCQSCLIDPKQVAKTIKEIKGYSNGKSNKDKPSPK